MSDLEDLNILNPNLSKDEIRSIVKGKSKAKGRRQRGDYAEALVMYIENHGSELATSLVREYRFHETRRWRFDLAWPEHKIATEVDGGEYAPGGGRHAKPSDYEKMNQAVLLGWRVLRYRISQIENDPLGVIDEIERLLAG